MNLNDHKAKKQQNELLIWRIKSLFNPWLPLNSHYLVMLSCCVHNEDFFYGTVWSRRCTEMKYVSYTPSSQIRLLVMLHRVNWSTNIIAHLIHLTDNIKVPACCFLSHIFQSSPCISGCLKTPLSPTNWKVKVKAHHRIWRLQKCFARLLMCNQK